MSKSIKVDHPSAVSVPDSSVTKDLLDHPLFTAYTELQHKYQRLERRLNKITKIGDLMQAQIMELNQELQLRANTDPLTGLLNRGGLYPRMNQLVEQVHQHHSSFGILLLDLDYFKFVNDQYGHQTGDRLLVAVSQVLRDAMRSEDLCARWGGEEFLLLFPGYDGLQTMSVGETLLAAVRAIRLPDLDHMPVTMSAGVYSAEGSGVTLDDCIRRADLALYQAKARGRNCLVIYAPELEQSRVVLSE